MAILRTNQYTIGDGIDEYDEIDGDLVSNHDDTTSSVIRTPTAVRIGIASFATGCDGSEGSQNTTRKAQLAYVRAKYSHPFR